MLEAYEGPGAGGARAAGGQAAWRAEGSLDATLSWRVGRCAHVPSRTPGAVFRQSTASLGLSYDPRIETSSRKCASRCQDRLDGKSLLRPLTWPGPCTLRAPDHGR